MSTDESLQRLQQIKHIVVLMMENRSFDQMLGYLKKAGLADVRGLERTEVNYDDEGKLHKVFEWGTDQTSFHPPQDHSGKVLDPCHSPDCVAQQLADGNGGFVKNFLATRKDKDGNPISIPEEYHDLPMGFYTQEHLPVYDNLARQYCVCDAWHASIPGDTWPNRLYSLAGRQADSVLHKPGFWASIVKRLKVVPSIGKLANAPIYEVEAFTRQLDPKQWRWYSHDPATLRGADKRYRELFDLNRENFAYFDRKVMSVVTDVLESAAIELHDGFLDDAAKGQLRDVSWIDPNFIDLKILDPNSNDDHPPSDVHAGQALVLELYEALVNSPDWLDTLLVVVYDEHGGFYDHVEPPPKPFGDPSPYDTLGVRVPAIIVGPRVRNSVCHQTLEHTTLISTILHRFAADPERAIANMPERVRGAPHLGALLEAEPRPELSDRAQLQAQIGELRTRLDQWRNEARQQRRAKDGAPSAVADGGAGQPQELHDWQEQFLGFAMTMRDAGLPPGHP